MKFSYLSQNYLSKVLSYFVARKVNQQIKIATKIENLLQKIYFMLLAKVLYSQCNTGNLQKRLALTLNLLMDYRIASRKCFCVVNLNILKAFA